MRALIDRDMITPIMSIAGHILKNNFLYDWEDIDFFERNFARVVNGEHTNLYLNATDEFKHFIWCNQDARQKFTANFLGFYLLDTLNRALKFNEMELFHFENILLKFLKEVEPVEHAQEYARENHRNPFTPL
jgi:hypothetical protein